LSIEQLLKIAKIPNGSRQSQANAVVSSLEWELTQKVVGMSFDMTASYTGRMVLASSLKQRSKKTKFYAGGLKLLSTTVVYSI